LRIVYEKHIIWTEQDKNYEMNGILWENKTEIMQRKNSIKFLNVLVACLHM
jgi:hypothetical protein